MELIAKVTSVIYSNHSNGFYIFKAKFNDTSEFDDYPDLLDKNDNISVRGQFFGVKIEPGVKVSIKGSVDKHPKYGYQIHALSCNIIPDSGKIGVVKYLVSNVKSIGPITAEKLYDFFGEDLINVLNDSPERISEAGFLNKSQISSIIAEWSNSNCNRSVVIFLTDNGLNTKQVKSFLSSFRIDSGTLELIKKNPYILFDVNGIGFGSIDRIALNLGFDVLNESRIKCMILHSINEVNFQNGNMFTDSDTIKNYINSKFFTDSNLPSTVFYDALKALEVDDKIKYYNTSDGRRCLYISSDFEYENGASSFLAKLIGSPNFSKEQVESSINKYEAENDIILSDQQKSAFHMLSEHKVCVITGYPGTGKTLLISAIVKMLKYNSIDFSLMSPTGIAAKRISQVTGVPATTIHRGLGYNPISDTWMFNQDNRFQSSVVIIDEMSMIDARLFHTLLKSLSENTTLVMVGDDAQLPSVGSGSVLSQLIELGKDNIIGHVKLTDIYRQQKLSSIITTAHSILKNEPIDIKIDSQSEITYIPCNKESILGHITNLASVLFEKKRNFQVIAPMYNGINGVNNLNENLREILNTDFEYESPKVKIGEVDIYIGDRVMIVKNDYQNGVYNGDVGKVTNISLKDDKITIKVFNWYDSENNSYHDKTIEFNIAESRDKLKVAYAVTVHKVQGQEYDYVVMPMTYSYGVMLYKNLVYTALTRAKKKVFMIGELDAFRVAASIDKDSRRNTNLCELTKVSITKKVNES